MRPTPAPATADTGRPPCGRPPGTLRPRDGAKFESWEMFMRANRQALRVGVGGPVGSGKTALLEVLCKALRDRYDIAVVTNDIYTQEDAQILMRAEALPFERIVGVETMNTLRRCEKVVVRASARVTGSPSSSAEAG